MSTLGWMSVSRMTRRALTRGRSPRRLAKYKIQPMLESLEEMVLLSTGNPMIGERSVQLEDSTVNIERHGEHAGDDRAADADHRQPGE